jgi:hypothetical protein
MPAFDARSLALARAVLSAFVAIAPRPVLAQEAPHECQGPARPCAPAGRAESGFGTPIGVATLDADRLELGDGEARAERARLSSCGGCASPWSVSARRALLRTSGDVDLLLPVLRIGRLPVLWLPWLRVRTGRRAGLLPPRLGVRAGGGVELGEGAWVPLGERYELVARAAYLTALIGAELEVELAGDGLDLRALGQLGARGSGALVTGAGWTRRGSLTAAAQLDWTLDPALARALATSAADEARSHEVTVAAVSWDVPAAQAALWTELTHALPRSGPADFYEPVTGLSLAVLPRRLGPLWVSLREATQARWWPLDRPDDAWPRWHTALATRLTWPFEVGPVATRLEVASLHAAWGRDALAAEDGAAGRNLLVAAADLSLPLVAPAGPVRHLIEPAVRYRLALVDTLPATPEGLAADAVAWPVAGNVLWVQLRSLTDASVGREALRTRVVVGQMLSWRGPAGLRAAPRLDVRLEVETALATLWLAISVDERAGAVGDAWTRVRLGRVAGTGLALEWRWLGDASTWASGPDALATVPLVMPLDARSVGHAVSVEGWLALPRGFRLEAEGAIDLEHRALVFAGGAFAYRHRCGCLGAAVRVLYRAGREWPDVMVTADVGGLGAR